MQTAVTKDIPNLLIDLEFVLVRGERLFVERIDITGNTATLDRVLRRQFRIAIRNCRRKTLSRVAVFPVISIRSTNKRSPRTSTNSRSISKLGISLVTAVCTRTKLNPFDRRDFSS